MKRHTSIDRDAPARSLPCSEGFPAPEGPSLVAMGGSPWKVCRHFHFRPGGAVESTDVPAKHESATTDWNRTARDTALEATTHNRAFHDGPSGAT